MTKLLATCLADDAEQRPTAGSLLEQLQALADGSTTTTSQAPAQSAPTQSAPADTDTSADVASADAASDVPLSMENFDLNFEDDDTATFAVSESAADTASSTEAHGPMASASRLADFDLGSFADEDDEDDAMMPASGSAADDYDFFAAGDEDDDTDVATGGSVDTNDLGQAFEADFGGATFADTASDDDDSDYGDSNYGDDGFADDFSEDALVSRDNGAFQADGFASADDTDDMDDSASFDSASFDSFDDDFADEPAAGGGLASSSGGGLGDLSDIMAPANNPAANAPTSDQPIAKADAGEFIKGLPTGATVRTVESKKKAPAQELPASKQAKVYMPPSKRKKRNLGRKIGVVALVAALGVLVFVALDRYGVLDPPPPPNPVATFFPLNVSVRPASIAQAQLVVVSSPEDSVHDAGDEMATVPARVFLDSEGTWQLRARFQDALSEVQTLTVPGPNAVTFEIPVPEEDLEPPPNQ
jgi:hypothetical protein